MNHAKASLQTLYMLDDAEIDTIKEGRDMVYNSEDDDMDAFVRILLPRILHSHGIYGMMQDVRQVGFLLRLIEEL